MSDLGKMYKYFVIIPIEILTPSTTISKFKACLNDKFIYASNFINNGNLVQVYAVDPQKVDASIDKTKSAMDYLNESIYANEQICIFVLYKPPTERLISSYLKFQIDLLKKELWKDLHLTALNTALTAEQQEIYFNKWLKKLELSCGMCYNEFNMWLNQKTKTSTGNSPKFGPNFFKWTVRAHNIVNMFLAKQTVDFKKAYEYWSNFNEQEYYEQLATPTPSLSTWLGEDFANYRNEIQNHFESFHQQIMNFIQASGNTTAFTTLHLDYLSQLGVNIFSKPYTINSDIHNNNIHTSDQYNNVSVVIGRYDQLNEFATNIHIALPNNVVDANFTDEDVDYSIIRAFYPDGLYEWMLDNINVKTSHVEAWISALNSTETIYVEYFFGTDSPTHIRHRTKIDTA